MNASRRDFLKNAALGTAALAAPVIFTCAARAKAAAPARRPNFVFILADDYGFMDTTFNGSKFYETPCLDRLAAQGMRFTEGYAACPVCSPTRASIMTGKYPARLHLTNWIPGNPVKKLIGPDYLLQMPLEEVTLAEALKEAGYFTCFVGKWHLGDGEYTPEAQGFDVNIGGYQAGSPRSYFSPYQNPKLADGPQGEYLTDRLTDESLRILDAHRDKPFLLYLSHYAVHNPKQGKPDIAAKFAEKLTSQPKPTGPEFLPEPPVQARQIQNDPVYAAMVKSMDESVGRIMKKLEDLGIAESTVVIFMSDNGGLSTAEGMPTSNVPLRGGKGWLYEGGVREPMLIKWPGVVKPGSVWSEPVVSTDFYPTMLEMAGLPPRPAQHCDGRSLVPLLREGKAPERKAIFWHYPHYSNQGGGPAAGVRAGDWKLIRNYEDGHHELYNIKQDLSEKNDLAAKMPDKVKELGALLDAFLKDTNAAMPRPNPAWDPTKPNGGQEKKAKAGKGKNARNGKKKQPSPQARMDQAGE